MAVANVVTFLGGNTGLYSVPSVTPHSYLVKGEAQWIETETNYSNSFPYVLLTSAIVKDGWYVSAGQIVDPKKADWRGYKITWFYI